jgi:hypothetical protein
MSENFEYAEAETAAPRRAGSALIWNILTIVMLLGTVCLCLGFLMIFVNPYSALNPLPPPTKLPSLILPSATPTNTPTRTPLIVLPPTWTPKPTDLPTETSTPMPSPTPQPSSTPIGLATATATREVTPGGFAFEVQAGTPKATSNLFHTDLGCNWMGIGGQALDLRGSPITGLVIQLGGVLEGKLYETKLTVTGTATDFGPGGYEFQIADKPIASTSTLWLQLLDQAGLPLSDKITFDTFADCEKALIYLNFQQVK